MFTGLVEGVGELVERKPTSGGFRLRIGTPLSSEIPAPLSTVTRIPQT